MQSITLTKPAELDGIDTDGQFIATTQSMKLRVRGELNPKAWNSRIKTLWKNAKKDGWKDFKVDIDLGDKRSKTVVIDRDQEAQEILFVRSKEVNFKEKLDPCNLKIVEPIVRESLKIIKDS